MWYDWLRYISNKYIWLKCLHNEYTLWYTCYILCKYLRLFQFKVSCLNIMYEVTVNVDNNCSRLISSNLNMIVSHGKIHVI